MNNMRVNNQIRVPKVRVIKDKQNIGVFLTKAAQQMAWDEGLDLVEVDSNANPPVCQIIDFGKFKYEQKIKDREKKQGCKALQPKEVDFSPIIDAHDVEWKTNKILKFVKEGRKVTIKVQFKGRHQAHKDVGFKLVEEILKSIENDVIVIKSCRCYWIHPNCFFI